MDNIRLDTEGSLTWCDGCKLKCVTWRRRWIWSKTRSFSSFFSLNRMRFRWDFTDFGIQFELCLSRSQWSKSMTWTSPLQRRSLSLLFVWSGPAGIDYRLCIHRLELHSSVHFFGFRWLVVSSNMPRLSGIRGIHGNTVSLRSNILVKISLVANLKGDFWKWLWLIKQLLTKQVLSAVSEGSFLNTCPFKGALFKMTQVVFWRNLL